jgi:hypothetical protein
MVNRGVYFLCLGFIFATIWLLFRVQDLLIRPRLWQDSGLSTLNTTPFHSTALKTAQM